MKLEGHPHKRALLDALAQRRLTRLEAFLEHFMNELLITGRRLRLFTFSCCAGACMLTRKIDPVTALKPCQ